MLEVVAGEVARRSVGPVAGCVYGASDAGELGQVLLIEPSVEVVFSVLGDVGLGGVVPRLASASGGVAEREQSVQAAVPELGESFCVGS